MKHALDNDTDRYPESPRLYPLRAILADDVLITARKPTAKMTEYYLSSQTSSMRQPLVMLLTMIVSPFT